MLNLLRGINERIDRLERQQPPRNPWNYPHRPHTYQEQEDYPPLTRGPTLLPTPLPPTLPTLPTLPRRTLLPTPRTENTWMNRRFGGERPPNPHERHQRPNRNQVRTQNQNQNQNRNQVRTQNQNQNQNQHPISTNPEFQELVKGTYRHCQIRHHQKNWEEIPTKIRDMISQTFSNITPPSPNEELRETLKELQQETERSITRTVQRHLTKSLEDTKETLKKLNPTDRDTALSIVYRQLADRIGNKLPAGTRNSYLAEVEKILMENKPAEQQPAEQQPAEQQPAEQQPKKRNNNNNRNNQNNNLNNLNTQNEWRQTK